MQVAECITADDSKDFEKCYEVLNGLLSHDFQYDMQKDNISPHVILSLVL